MPKKIILPFLLIFLFCSVKAQDKVVQNITYENFIVNDTIYRYQVGINSHFALEGLFNDSLRKPVELMIRRQVSLSQAVRFRILGITENFKWEDSDDARETHKSTFGIALGYEWQNLLSKRWKFYYGSELLGKLSWENSVDELDVFDENTNEVVDLRRVRKRKTEQIALLPFTGIRFQITPFLFLSTEIKIEAYHEKFRSRRDSYWTRSDGSVAKPFSEFSIKNSNIHFQPYTGIYLNLIL